MAGVANCRNFDKSAFAKASHALVYVSKASNLKSRRFQFLLFFSFESEYMDFQESFHLFHRIPQPDGVKYEDNGNCFLGPLYGSAKTLLETMDGLMYFAPQISALEPTVLCIPLGILLANVAS